MPPNPGWPSPTIHYCPDANCVFLDSVVDREWKPLGKGAVEAPVRNSMNTPEHLMALDIGVQADEKIPAKSLFLILIIMEASDQIIPGKVEDWKPH